MSSVVMRKKWEARLNTRISGPATKWPPRRSCTCADGPAHHVANSAGKCCNKNVVNDSVRVRSASERLDEMCGRVGTFSQNNHEKAGRSFTTNCGASCNVSDRDFRVYKNEMGAMPASDYIRWVRSQANPGMVNCPSSTVGGGGAVVPFIDPNAQKFFENVLAFYTTGISNNTIQLNTDFVANTGFVDLSNTTSAVSGNTLNTLITPFPTGGKLLAQINSTIGRNITTLTDDLNVLRFTNIINYNSLVNFNSFYDATNPTDNGNSINESHFYAFEGFLPGNTDVGGNLSTMTILPNLINLLGKFQTDINNYKTSVNDHDSVVNNTTILNNLSDNVDNLISDFKGLEDLHILNAANDPANDPPNDFANDPN